MSSLLQHVAKSIRLRQLLPAGEAVLVAVSGGLDSMVLLHALRELSDRFRWRLAVAHLNHQLRGTESDADEQLVQHTTRQFGLPMVVERADVRAFAQRQRLSLEMAARELRHAFLARAASQEGSRLIALAHHADDQVELFFLRLLRGSGGEGLAGMRWRSPSPADPRLTLVRPLLDLPKSSLLELAVEDKIPFREDASNASFDIQRNRIRHELLPLLRREYQPALDKTVLRVMDILGAEAECSAHQAQGWWEQVREAKGGVKKAAFESLPIAVQRWCLKAQLLELGLAPDFDLIERLRLAPNKAVSVAFRPPGASIADPAGLGIKSSHTVPQGGRKPDHALARRDADGQVRVQRKRVLEFTRRSLELDLRADNRKAAFGGVQLRWSFGAAKSVQSRTAACGKECFDAERVGSSVVLRHWEPGDRFQPIGMPASVKLQDIFTNLKLPRAHRHNLVVAATAQGELFWVEGLRISERFKLTPTTNRSLHWAWERL